MAEITGIDVAVKNIINDVITNVTYRKPSLVGLMKGLDNYWNRGVKTVDSIAIQGGKMAVNFWVDKPAWTGVNALDPVYSNRAIPMTKRTKIVQGAIIPSAKQFAEMIDLFELNRLKDSGGAKRNPFRNWIKQVSERAAEAFIESLDADLWPNTNQVGGTGSGPGSIQTLMAFAYPLQSGYANNEPTGAATVYSYLSDVDLNLYPEAKAINVGTTTVSFNPTYLNIKEKLIFPLRTRGANVDLVLCGEKTFSYIGAALDSTLRQAPQKTLQFGGPFYQFPDGIFVVCEPSIDRLAANGQKEELYVGDSSTLKFGTQEDPSTVRTLEIPSNPSANVLQGYAEAAFFNENPRFWGRAYNVVRP